MGTRHDWTEFVRRMAQPIIENATAAGMAPRSDTSKYRSKRCRVDGLNFASQLEARCYESLKLRQRAGEVLWFIRQPPFALEGGITYRADFLAVLAQGGVEVLDAKGYLTPVSKIKIRQVEARYGFKVHLWDGK